MAPSLMQCISPLSRGGILEGQAIVAPFSSHFSRAASLPDRSTASHIHQIVNRRLDFALITSSLVSRQGRGDHNSMCTWFLGSLFRPPIPNELTKQSPLRRSQYA